MPAEQTAAAGGPRSAAVVWLLYALIGAGELIHLWLPFVHNPLHALWSDPGRWWEYASSGTATPPLALADPVLFQAWLSFVAKFTLDIPLLTALYAGLLSATTPWIWYRFLRELLPSRESALAGWAVLAWLPSWLGIYSYFMSETLLLPLLGIAFWASWRSLRRGDSGSFMLASLFWLLAAMTRGVVAPLAVGVMPFVWWRQRRRLAVALMASLLVVVALGLLGYRSYVKTGIVAPLGQAAMNRIYAISGAREIDITYYSKHGGGYHYVFGSPSMGQAPLAPFSNGHGSRRGSVRVRIDLDHQAASWAREERRVAAAAPPARRLVGENVVYLLFGPSWPDCNPAHLVEWISSQMRFVWAPLFVIALVALGLRAWRGDHRHAAPLLCALLLWFVVQGLLLIAVDEGRYRKPAEGVVVAALLLAATRRPLPTDGPGSSRRPAA